MYLISPATLAQESTSPHLKIIDCRFSLADTEAGEQAYLTGHLPGAQYAHLDRDLSGPAVAGKTGRHPLPDQASLLKSIQRFGISNEDQVVAYDQNNGAFAARLWWLLRWMGHDQVRVLDGGLDAWTKNGFALEAKTPAVTASHFQAGPPLTRIVSASDLESAELLLDARDRDRFAGRSEPIDPVAGHIPGARCLPFTDNLESDNSFKTAKALYEQFKTAGIAQGSTPVCYCGSGVTACHNILALKLAGYPEPALYPGSWSEWITDPARPVSRDE